MYTFDESDDLITTLTGKPFLVTVRGGHKHHKMTALCWAEDGFYSLQRGKRITLHKHRIGE